MAKRRGRHQTKINQQIKSILSETDNPAVIQDVADTEFGVIPESVESGEEERNEEITRAIVRNSVDGKTWNQL